MKTKGSVKDNIEQGIRKNLSRIVVGMVLLLSGCAPVKVPTVVEVPPAPALVKLSPSAYPALSDDLNYEGLNHCIQMSLTYLRKVPRAAPLPLTKKSFRPLLSCISRRKNPS